MVSLFLSSLGAPSSQDGQPLFSLEAVRTPEEQAPPGPGLHLRHQGSSTTRGSRSSPSMSSPTSSLPGGTLPSSEEISVDEMAEYPGSLGLSMLIFCAAPLASWSPKEVQQREGAPRLQRLRLRKATINFHFFFRPKSCILHHKRPVP